MDFSPKVEILYEISTQNNEFNIDEIFGDIREMFYKTSMIHLPLINKTISIINCLILIKGELEDPLINKINSFKLDYEKICNICNFRYCRTNFLTCNKCATFNNIPESMKELISKQRGELLMIKPQYNIEDCIYCSKEDTEKEIKLTLMSYRIL